MHRTGSIDVALERLAAMPVNGHSVLSLYLDLDPSRFPHLRDRHMQLDALLDDAKRRYLSDELPHDQRMAVRADIERVRSLLTDDNDAELAVESGRGLAVFCSTPADMLELVTLPRPVKGTVAIEQPPFIEPLVELEPHARWCVLLVSRRAARILRGTRERLVEVSDTLDDVRQHTAQGGLSQARYQRGVEHEVDEHVKSTCADLFGRWQRRPFDRLALAAPAELRPRVEAELHAELRQRLAGHFEVEVEHATVDEIRQRASEVIEVDERRHEEAALDKLREGLAPGGHAAAGVDDVLEALNERRVGTLLIAHGASAPDDILERAVELAREQSAEVLFVLYDAEEFAQHGPIAALLRY